MSGTNPKSAYRIDTIARVTLVQIKPNARSFSISLRAFRINKLLSNRYEGMYSAFINRYDASGSELLIINRNTPYWGRNKACLQLCFEKDLGAFIFFRERNQEFMCMSDTRTAKQNSGLSPQ